MKKYKVVYEMYEHSSIYGNLGVFGRYEITFEAIEETAWLMAEHLCPLVDPNSKFRWCINLEEIY